MPLGAYDANGIWIYGTSDLASPADVLLNKLAASVSAAQTRPATQYKAVGTRAALSASTWHDLPFDTIANTQGTTPWALNNAGTNYRVEVTVAGFYRITATASLAAANFALRVLNVTTGQVMAQGPVSTAASSLTSSLTAEGYLAVNDEMAVQIYYAGVFNTLTDSLTQPTRYTITKA